MFIYNYGHLKRAGLFVCMLSVSSQYFNCKVSQDIKYKDILSDTFDNGNVKSKESVLMVVRL